MDSFQHKHRTIIEETGFKEQIKKLRVAYRRLDEVMEDGLSFTLCRRPETYPRVPGSTIRRVRILGCVGIPDCNIWFWNNEEEVHLIAIDAIEE